MSSHDRTAAVDYFRIVFIRQTSVAECKQTNIKDVKKQTIN